MLDDQIFARLKKEALKGNKSLKDCVNGLLAWALHQKGNRSDYKFNWPTIRGETQPSVNIHDRDRLIDFMNES